MVKKMSFKIKLYLLIMVMGFAGIFCAISLSHASVSAYAESGKQFEIDYVPIEQVEIAAECGVTTIMPDSKVNLETILTPWYAVETLVNQHYEIISGNGFAKIEDNAVVVKDLENHASIIGETIIVKAICDGIDSNQLKLKVVKRPVESVSLNTSLEQINQGATLQLNPIVSPSNSSNKQLNFELTEGGSYASISSNGLIRVNDNLPAGDLIIRVKASSKDDPVKYDEREFRLYVPTKNLSISADKINPRPGEIVTLNAHVDGAASVTTPEFIIIKGENFIQSGIVSDGKIKIKDLITEINPQIVIECMRDGVKASLTLNVYFPTINFTIFSDKTEIKQGETANLSIANINPLNANQENLLYKLSDASKAYATINEKTGALTAKANMPYESIDVYVTAYIDSVTSNQLSITVKKPNILLTANKSVVSSSNVVSEEISFSVVFEGQERTTGLTYNFKNNTDKYVIGGSVINNKIAVAKGISDKNPKIALSASYDGYESNEITIDINILVDYIAFKNAGLSQVEQDRQYDLSATASSSNTAEIKTGIEYTLEKTIVDSGYAVVDKITGQLLVSASAPIGTQISVTAKHVDGAETVRILTVRRVYAESLTVIKVSNQKGEITSENKVLPSDILTFEVKFGTADNISADVKTFSISFVSGDTTNATIYSSSQIQIKASNLITKTSPTFTVRASSNQNGTIISDDKQITVYVPVTAVALTANTTYINQGSTASIASIFRTEITPLYSNIRSASYEIIFGENYASIIGDNIVVNSNLPTGDLSIIIEASVEGKISTASVKLYVAAKSIAGFTASNYNPVSKISSGESVTLTVTPDSIATWKTTQVTIVSGAELIAGGYANGAVLPSAFSVANNAVSKANKIIKLKAIQLGIDGKQEGDSKEITITVYAPAETKFISDASIDRGKNKDINVSLGHATATTWSWDYYTITYPSGSGLSNKTVYNGQSGPATIDVTGKKINISANVAPGGTVVTMYYHANETIGTAKQLSSSFTVARLIASDSITPAEQFGTNGTTINSSDLFKLVYNNGDGSKFLSDRRQLKPSGYTNIDIKFAGEDLSFYGATSSKIVVSGNDSVWNASVSNLNRLRLDLYSTANGKNSISYYIEIKDGAYTYKLSPAKNITVFRDNGALSLTDYNIKTKTVNVAARISGIASDATLTKLDLVYERVTSTGETGYSFSGSTFTVTSATPSDSCQVKVSYSLIYNNTTVQYSKTFVLKMVFAQIDNKGGSGISKVSFASGPNDNISIPTLTGHTFDGYFSSGSNLKVYGSSGQRMALLSEEFDKTLYAQWTPYKFTITFYLDGINETHSEITLHYGQSYVVNAPAKSGWDRTEDWHYDRRNNGQLYILQSTYQSATIVSYHTVNGAWLGYIDLVYEKEGCVADGTLITLADGSQKAVELLSIGDMVTVWNHHTGKFDIAPVSYMHVVDYSELDIVHLYFSDGTDLKIINGHCLWDFDLNKYVFIDHDNAEEFLGHWFNKQTVDSDGKLYWTRIQLIDVAFETEYTRAWGPLTHGHMNLYINGMLSITGDIDGIINIFEVDGETMQYNQHSYLADIEEYGLFTYADFAHLLPETIYEAFNAKYLKVAMGKGLITWDDIYKIIEKHSETLFN